MSRNNQAVKLFHEIAITTEIIGVENMRKVAVDARKTFSGDNEELEKEIKRVIVQKYGFPFKDLKEGTGYGLRMEAITVLCIAYTKYLNYSSNKAAELLDKDPSNIRKRITKFNSLNENDKLDSKTIERATRVFSAIDKFILDKKNNS